MYGLSELPGGLRVVTATMPHLASVSVGIWVNTGGRHETARENGAAHFIEHMLFKGTRRRSAARISQDVEGIGGYLNAFTDEEHTCFYSRAVASRLPELLDVLCDMFLESKFASTEISKERDVILEEQAMYRDQPAELVHDLLNQVQFPGHPLGRPVIGSARSVRGLRREDLLGFFERRYISGSIVIAAAGNLTHANLLTEVERWVRRFRQGVNPAAEPAPATPEKPRWLLHSKKTEQTHLALGFRTASRQDERRFALRLLNVLLGENMSSRLFQTIREEHGLAYNIQSTGTSWSDCGDLVISAGLEDAQLEKALKLILKEVQRLADRAPGRGELSRARDYALGQADLSLEGSEQMMMWLGEQVLGFGRVIPPEETRARIAAVQPAEIRRVARDFLNPSRLSLALVSPRTSDRGLGALVESWVGR
jgi:predicted Zn-dependent peptidase